MYKYSIYDNNSLNAYTIHYFIIFGAHTIDYFILFDGMRKFSISNMIMDFYIPLFEGRVYKSSLSDT